MDQLRWVLPNSPFPLIALGAWAALSLGALALNLRARTPRSHLSRFATAALLLVDSGSILISLHTSGEAPNLAAFVA